MVLDLIRQIFGKSKKSDRVEIWFLSISFSAVAARHTNEIAVGA